jgi:RHS repeat-associated protein
MPWRFQGRLDVAANSGAATLYDMSARDYSPGLGTFTSLDSVAGAAADPRSMNRYAYAQANPWTLVDPTGHGADCYIGQPCTDEERAGDLARQRQYQEDKAKAEASATSTPAPKDDPNDERSGAREPGPALFVTLPNGARIDVAHVVPFSAAWQQLSDYCAQGTPGSSLWNMSCKAVDSTVDWGQAAGQVAAGAGCILDFCFWKDTYWKLPDWTFWDGVDNPATWINLQFTANVISLIGTGPSLVKPGPRRQRQSGRGGMGSSLCLASRTMSSRTSARRSSTGSKTPPRQHAALAPQRSYPHPLAVGGSLTWTLATTSHQRTQRLERWRAIS